MNETTDTAEPVEVTEPVELSEEQAEAARTLNERADRDREAQERELTPIRREVTVDPIAENIRLSTELTRKVRAGEVSVSDLHDAKSLSDPSIIGARESYLDNVAKSGLVSAVRRPDGSTDSAVLELDDRLKALDARVAALESTLGVAFKQQAQASVSANPE